MHFSSYGRIRVWLLGAMLVLVEVGVSPSFALLYFSLLAIFHS